MSLQPPRRLFLQLDMDEARIAAEAEAALIGVHATRLPDHIGHEGSNFDLLWQADGSAILTIRLWQDAQPPFRHAVVVIILAFDNGLVSGIEETARRSFGA